MAKPIVLSTVKNALQVIELLAREKHDWGVTELAQHFGLNKSVVHSLLSTLLESGFVSSDPATRRYRLGLKILTLAAAMDVDQEIRRSALPIMEALTAKTGEASFLMAPRGSHAICVARVLIDQPLRITMEEGTATPLQAAASGKAILAFMSPATVQWVLDQTGLPKLGSKTISDLPAFLRHLAEVREKGYAYSESEVVEGMWGLAVPLFGAGESVVASLGLAGIRVDSADRSTKLLPSLRSHAKRLSQALGRETNVPGGKSQ